MSDKPISIEVAYAKPEEQVVIPLELEPGATLRLAIERSGLLPRFPEIDLETAKVGIFSKVAQLDAELSAGDRVEIYRPLIADPKEARKKRAAEGKQMTKGGGRNSAAGGGDGEDDSAEDDAGGD